VKGGKAVSWDEVCFTLGEVHGKTPMVIDASFSYRQLQGFYKMWTKKQVEKLKMQGYKIKGEPEGNVRQIDLRPEASESKEEWLSKAAQVHGMLSGGSMM